MREYLAGKGVSEPEAAALMAPVTLNVLGKNGVHGNSKSSFLVAYVLFFLMYMVVLLYGMNVARSIIAEKTSRVFEVLLATITPDELLAGKIIGVGGVGLTQVAIWMAAAGLIAARLGSDERGADQHAAGCAVLHRVFCAGICAVFERWRRRWER